jgi:hypothetical protein
MQPAVAHAMAYRVSREPRGQELVSVNCSLLVADEAPDVPVAIVAFSGCHSTH